MPGRPSKIGARLLRGPVFVGYVRNGKIGQLFARGICELDVGIAPFAILLSVLRLIVESSSGMSQHWHMIDPLASSSCEKTAFARNLRMMSAVVFMFFISLKMITLSRRKDKQRAVVAII